MRRRSGFGWLELLVGVLLILLGIYTIINPGHALVGMVFCYGMIATIMGISDILFYIRIERYTGFGPVLSMISGILSIMTGIMLFVYPGTGVWVLSFLFPVWFIAHCISHLCHLSHIRFVSGRDMYYFTMIVNIIGLILGFAMILRPLFSLTVVGLLAGLYLVLLGIESVVLAVSKIGSRF